MKRPSFIAALVGAALVLSSFVTAAPATASSRISQFGNSQSGNPGQSKGKTPAKPANLNTGYFAFGDSFAAGTGVPGAQGTCLTSRWAYPQLLSNQVTSLACTGATSAHLPAQIAAAQNLSTATVITLTLGGNDIGWTNVLQACLAIGPTSPACIGASQAAATAIQTQPQRTAASIMALRMAAPQAKILVTGYPKLFDPAGATCTVASNLPPVNSSVLAQADALAVGLNQAIAGGVQGATLAGDTNVVFVDVADDFSGHGICRGARAWVNGLLILGVDPVTHAPIISTMSFHPNLRGELAYATALRPALRTRR